MVKTPRRSDTSRTVQEFNPAFALLARQLEREQDRVERAERRLEEERRLLEAERRRCVRPWPMRRRPRGLRRTRRRRCEHWRMIAAVGACCGACVGRCAVCNPLQRGKITPEELGSWRARYEAYGPAGLHVTRLQCFPRGGRS